MKTDAPSDAVIPLLLVTFALGWASCSKSEPGALAIPESPKEAAAQVEQVFQTAPPEVQQTVELASQGLVSGEYEQAVVSLQALRARENLTFEQGMAVHNSMVAMEAELIRAIEAGDPRAKQAYETLKRLKRN
jgi:thioredoxin-like negative regulator of GroEL